MPIWNTEHEDPGAWMPDELVTLRRLYGSRTDAALARRLGRPAAEVAAKAAELGLAKNKAAFPGSRRMPRWTPAEVALLIRLYPSTANVAIARELGRSVKSVVSKAYALGLEKARARRQAAARANVMLRRDRQGGAR